MSGNELATRDRELAIAGLKEPRLSEAIEAALATNDLSKLNVNDRIAWYNHRCEIAGLPPAARPFQFITLQGKLTLYATKEASDLLNGKHGISHRILSQETIDGVRVVTITARMGNRETTDIGAVPVSHLKGNELANALMKAITKAKRRATLSLCGLGDVLDETELETVDDQWPCDERGSQIPPKNDSGHGRGQYASPEQVKEYLDKVNHYLAKRNAQWLDDLSRLSTDGMPAGAEKDLCNIHQADNHLVKWAVETGRLEVDPRTRESGVRSRQIGLYTAIVYHRSKADQGALSRELRRYLDEQASRQEEKIRLAHPELFADEPLEDEPDGDEIDAEWEPGSNG